MLQKCFRDYITGQALLALLLLHEVVGGRVHVGHHGVDHDDQGGGEHAEASQQLQGEPEGEKEEQEEEKEKGEVKEDEERSISKKICKERCKRRS